MSLSTRECATYIKEHFRLTFELYLVESGEPCILRGAVMRLSIGDRYMVDFRTSNRPHYHVFALTRQLASEYPNCG